MKTINLKLLQHLEENRTREAQEACNHVINIQKLVTIQIKRREAELLTKIRVQEGIMEDIKILEPFIHHQIDRLKGLTVLLLGTLL